MTHSKGRVLCACPAGLCDYEDEEVRRPEEEEAETEVYPASNKHLPWCVGEQRVS